MNLYFETCSQALNIAGVGVVCEAGNGNGLPCNIKSFNFELSKNGANVLIAIHSAASAIGTWANVIVHEFSVRKSNC